MRFWRAGDGDEACRLLIQPVHDAWPSLLSSGKADALSLQSIDKGRLIEGRRGMGCKAAWLDCDHKLLVLVGKLDLGSFIGGRNRGFRLIQLNHDLISRLDGNAWLGGILSIQKHPSLLDQSRNLGSAADVRNPCQDDIQAASLMQIKLFLIKQ